MDSISDFISQKEEIERLNKQIDMLAGFYHGFYKGQIKKLNTRLGNLHKVKGYYKLKVEAISGEKIETRSDKARSLIATLKGTAKPMALISEIAKRCNLSEHQIQSLWYKGK